ncbi:MAG: hypothetical protein IJ861_08955 [Clostridia bacterium]|nr:hypothetical protein [Clostridia bacterium]
MSPKEKNEKYIPKKPSEYIDNRSEEEKETERHLHKEYDNKNKDIPPLSQSEREHLTYLRILEQYNEAKIKRTNYRRYGSAFIIISALVFLTLIFSLETKIEFLCLWIVVILYCVAVMIRADYKYHTFKEYLGIADEFDYYGMDEDDEEDKPPEPGIKQAKTETVTKVQQKTSAETEIKSQYEFGTADKLSKNEEGKK